MPEMTKAELDVIEKYGIVAGEHKRLVDEIRRLWAELSAATSEHACEWRVKAGHLEMARDRLRAELAQLRNMTHTPIGTTWRETAEARFKIMQELRVKVSDWRALARAREMERDKLMAELADLADRFSKSTEWDTKRIVSYAEKVAEIEAALAVIEAAKAYVAEARVASEPRRWKAEDVLFAAVEALTKLEK
jgi:hypothetical protein